MSRKTAIIIIVIVFIIFIIASILILSGITEGGVRVKGNSYLVIPLYGDIPEYSTKENIFSRKEPLTMWNFYRAVELARKDKRIKGIILKVYNPQIGMGKIEEIIEVLKDFKKSGKKIYSFLEYAGMRDYMIASVSDKIYMLPTGTLIFKGFSFEVMFYKGFLEKLGIKADLLHIGDYKTASNLFTENKMTPAHREVMEYLLNEFSDYFLMVVSENRGLKEEDIKRFFNTPFLTPEKAKELELIDGIAYYDQVIEEISKEHNKLKPFKKINRISFTSYLYRKKPYPSSKNIAIIFAYGQIESGQSGYNPLYGEMLGSETLIASIKRARDDDSIKAIVLRVNSPGGSGVASDEILRALKVAARKKPIVVSMSDLAASGGYWISMGAHRIISHRLTLTGSIGVIAGKFSLKRLYEKLGFNIERVEKEKYAHILSSTDEFSPEERKILYKNIEDFYNKFLKVVAEGRKLSIKEVDSIGRGRVWTGESALKIKLVDKIGGLRDAISEAAKLSKIGKYYGIKTFPKKKSFFEELFTENPFLSKINIKRLRENIFPYKSFEPLTIMNIIPELKDK